MNDSHNMFDINDRINTSPHVSPDGDNMIDEDTVTDYIQMDSFSIIDEIDSIRKIISKIFRYKGKNRLSKNVSIFSIFRLPGWSTAKTFTVFFNFFFWLFILSLAIFN